MNWLSVNKNYINSYMTEINMIAYNVCCWYQISQNYPPPPYQYIGTYPIQIPLVPTTCTGLTYQVKKLGNLQISQGCLIQNCDKKSCDTSKQICGQIMQNLWWEQLKEQIKYTETSRENYEPIKLQLHTDIFNYGQGHWYTTHLHDDINKFFIQPFLKVKVKITMIVTNL